MRLKNIATLLTLMIVMSGCMTATAVSTSGVTSTSIKRTLMLEDNIEAIAAVTADAEHHGDLVLLGQQKAYHINQGNEQLAMLTALPHPESVAINKYRETAFTLSGTQFKGSLDVVYARETYSAKELSILSAANMRLVTANYKPKQYYEGKIYLAGTVYAKPENIAYNPLAKVRAVKFYTEDRVTSVNADRVITTAFVLPFTLAFDAISLPLQAIIYGADVSSTAKGKR